MRIRDLVSFFTAATGWAVNPGRGWMRRALRRRRAGCFRAFTRVFKLWLPHRDASAQGLWLAADGEGPLNLLVGYVRTL